MNRLQCRRATLKSRILYALVAQSVEHLTFNQVVGGSIPLQRTIDAFLVRILREENRQRYTLDIPSTKVRLLPAA